MTANRHVEAHHTGSQFVNTEGYLHALIADQDLALHVENRSERTRADYRRSGRAFAQWLLDRGDYCPVADISRQTIREYFAHLAQRTSSRTGRTLSDAYRAKEWRNLRRLFNFAVAEGVIGASPLEGQRGPAVKAKPVPVIRDAEFADLLAEAGKGVESPNATERFIAWRRVAAVELARATGLRAGELSNLDAGDIDPERQVVRAHGKTGHREIWVSPTALLAVRRMTRARRRAAIPGDDTALFVSATGRRIQPSDLTQMFRRLGVRAGIAGPVTPTRLRHTAVHQFLLKGGQEGDATYRFGWAPGSTMTQRYGRSAAQERSNRRAQEQFESENR